MTRAQIALLVPAPCTRTRGSPKPSWRIASMAGEGTRRTSAGADDHRVTWGRCPGPQPVSPRARRGPGTGEHRARTQRQEQQMSATEAWQHRHSPVPNRLRGGGARRPAPAHRRDQVARARDGRRRLAGRAARDHAGPRALLGDGLRLEQVRGAAERPAELRDRDRRAGHPLHPRPLAARGRAAADRHARLARLDHRAAEDHRAAHRSHGARRQRGGRLPPGDPLAAGPRVLRQADQPPAGIRRGSRAPGWC